MRLHAEKGAEKIPSFVEGLLQENRELTLIIGGEGPQESELKRKTHQWGNRVRWLGWQDNAVRFLSALDFFFLLSREESFPQALVEASSLGLPWIAPDVGGVQELLQAGASGLLHPAGHIERAVSNARALLKQRDLFQSQAASAIARLRERYDIHQTIKSFYKIVSRLQA